MSQQSSSLRNKSFPAVDIASYAKMSQQEAQMEAQLRKRQQQYYAQKKARKKQIRKRKEEQFGLSSSEEDDVSSPKHQQQVSHKDQVFLKIENPNQSKMRASNTQAFKISYLLGNEWLETELKIKNPNYSIRGKERSFDQLVSLRIPANSKIHANPTFQIMQKGQNPLRIMVPNKVLEKDISSHYIIISSILEIKYKQLNGKIIQQNTPSIPQKLIINSDIYGYLFKRSQFLGKWEKRFMVSNKQGLFSYKNLNEKPSMAILWQQVKQISTKFQSYYQGLIITIHYNSSQTSIAVPILQPFEPKSKVNWLYAIYKRSVK